MITKPRYALKDIPDRLVLQMAHRWQKAVRTGEDVPWLWDQLRAAFPDYPEKVLYAKLVRMEERGLLDCGVSLRGAWPTEKACALYGLETFTDE